MTSKIKPLNHKALGIPFPIFADVGDFAVAIKILMSRFDNEEIASMWNEAGIAKFDSQPQTIDRWKTPSSTKNKKYEQWVIELVKSLFVESIDPVDSKLTQLFDRLDELESVRDRATITSLHSFYKVLPELSQRQTQLVHALYNKLP